MEQHKIDALNTIKDKLRMFSEYNSNAILELQRSNNELCSIELVYKLNELEMEYSRVEHLVLDIADWIKNESNL